MAESSQTVHSNLAVPAAYDISLTSVKTGEFRLAAHDLCGLALMIVLIAHILGGTAINTYESNQAYSQLVSQPWNFAVFGIKLFFSIGGFVVLSTGVSHQVRRAVNTRCAAEPCRPRRQRRFE